MTYHVYLPSRGKKGWHLSFICLSTERARRHIQTAPCTKWEGILVSERSCAVLLWSKQRRHLHVFLLIELMRVARSCASAKETRAVHLQLSEQTNALTHACALAAELTVKNLCNVKLLHLHVSTWDYSFIITLIPTQALNWNYSWKKLDDQFFPK